MNRLRGRWSKPEAVYSLILWEWQYMMWAGINLNRCNLVWFLPLRKKQFTVSKITPRVNNGQARARPLIPRIYKKIAICRKGC